MKLVLLIFIIYKYNRLRLIDSMESTKRGILMKLGNNVMKYRRKKDINVAVIVFLIIFIYVIINIYIFLTSDHLSIYEVKEGYTSDNNIFTGLIIRDEEVVHTQIAGYINYYHRDGDRVGKTQTTYSITDQKVASTLNSDAGELMLSNDDMDEVKKEVFDFQRSYNSANFTNVYDFKYELDGLILQLTNDNMLTNLNSTLTQDKAQNSYKIDSAKHSGVITYSMDGLEELTVDNINSEHFNVETYNKTSLRTMDIIEKDSPVYRLVKSDDWNIVLPLDKNQYEKLQGKERIKVTLGEKELELTVPLSFIVKNDEYYGVLSLNQYMIQFVNQRYIKVELEHNMAKGLKIPVSSIVTKEFYMVPLEYFTVGGDSSTKGVIMEDYQDNGDLEYVFVPTDIFYSDETYGYIDGRLFDDNPWLVKEDTNERFRISLTDTLKGVFNVNKGYAIFRRIEILYENEEYCIIAEGTTHGLSVYDHIALVGSTAIEQAIIY